VAVPLKVWTVKAWPVAFCICIVALVIHAGLWNVFAQVIWKIDSFAKIVPLYVDCEK
jgi:hypothetical protein